MSKAAEKGRTGLTAITIENFKGIREPVTVPLRPVTLLFGANSAGKSTVFHALLYAREVLESWNGDVYETKLGGDTVNLGGFRNLVHQHDLSRQISITLHYSGGPWEEKYLVPEHLDDLAYGYYVGDDQVQDHFDMRNLAVKIVVQWDNVAAIARVLKYEVGFNNDLFGYLHEDTLYLNVQHPLFEQGAQHEDFEWRHKWKRLHELFANAVPTPPPVEMHQAYRYLQEVQWSKHGPHSELPPMPDPEFVKLAQEKRHWQVELPRRHGFLLPWCDNPDYEAMDDESTRLINQLLFGACQSVLGELRSLLYLGPLREVPRRNYYLQPLKTELGWERGLEAWRALALNPPHWRTETTLVERVNEALERLSLGYRIHWEEQARLTVGGALYEGIRELLENPQKTRSKEAREALIEQLNKQATTPIVQIHDERTKTDVEPQDIGVGVSQVIPVIVGALHSRWHTLAVEQPELHLHPAVQVNLADVFLLEALRDELGKRAFFLETHSEHIVLRMMRRMRETFQGTLPADFPRVEPPDIAILYVEIVDGRTVIREMPLNERGELVKAWPGGFFEEALRETL